MTKATEIGRVSTKGGFHLLWGLVLSSIISAVGAIFTARILGPDNYGLYTIALAAPNLIATFRDWGINTAIVKYSAEYNGENKQDKIRSIFISGLFFELIMGISLSLLSFLLAGTLAQAFSRPTIVPLIQISSFMILTGALVNTATAAFTGMETMHLNSIMLIIQSILKTILVIALVLFGLGALGAVTGFIVASVFGCLSGIILMLTIYKRIKKSENGKLYIAQTIKTMLKYSLPLSIGFMIGNFATVFYSYILAIFVTNNAPIGNYSVALNFMTLISFFATPITTMLFPAFSKLNAMKDRQALKNVFQYSVKYSSLIVLPVAAMSIALANPAIQTLFADKYTQAPLFFGLLSLNYFTTAAGMLSVPSIINGQGYTKYGMKLSILTSAIGIPLSLFLIYKFGVVGLIATVIIAEMPSIFLGLRFIRNKFGITVDWISSLKITFSSTITGFITYIVVVAMPFSPVVQLIIGIVFFTLFYILLAIITQTIKKSDISNLKETVRGLGPLKKPLLIILNLIEKVFNIIHRQDRL
jgi:O-antigen/teichoic acid export membrane protein